MLVVIIIFFVILLVYCRIGSLENVEVAGDAEELVYCRIGSLEIAWKNSKTFASVYCRIGSLETSKEELNWLVQEVDQLKNTASDICNNHIDHLSIGAWPQILPPMVTVITKFLKSNSQKMQKKRIRCH